MPVLLYRCSTNSAKFFDIAYALGIPANCVFKRRAQPRQKQSNKSLLVRSIVTTGVQARQELTRRMFGKGAFMILRLRSGFRQRAQTPANRLNFNVWTERKRIEKLRYMHRNPGPGKPGFGLLGGSRKTRVGLPAGAMAME